MHIGEIAVGEFGEKGLLDNVKETLFPRVLRSRQIKLRIKLGKKLAILIWVFASGKP